MTSLNIANKKSVDTGKFLGLDGKVEAAELPNITTRLLASPVSLRRNWRHLLGLPLADPEFGVPGSIDVLLGAEVFSRVVRLGRIMLT